MMALHNKYLLKPVRVGGIMECSLCSERAQYRCTDCGPSIHHCESCCIAQHSTRCFYHVPEQWMNGQFSPVMLSNIEIPLDHSCLTERKEKITIVGMKGTGAWLLHDPLVIDCTFNYVQVTTMESESASVSVKA